MRWRGLGWSMRRWGPLREDAGGNSLAVHCERGLDDQSPRGSMSADTPEPLGSLLVGQVEAASVDRRDDARLSRSRRAAQRGVSRRGRQLIARDRVVLDDPVRCLALGRRERELRDLRAAATCDHRQHRACRLVPRPVAGAQGSTFFIGPRLKCRCFRSVPSVAQRGAARATRPPTRPEAAQIVDHRPSRRANRIVTNGENDAR